jgi:hypothetical protein
MIDKDEEYYREFTLNSKKFDDFYQDDDQEDFLMLLGFSFRDNISSSLQAVGVSWNGDLHIHMSTKKLEEVIECEEFIQYLEENKTLDELIEHYIKFNRRSTSNRLDELCAEYKLIKEAQNDYKELHRELSQNGIREVSDKKKNKL